MNRRRLLFLPLLVLFFLLMLKGETSAVVLTLPDTTAQTGTTFHLPLRVDSVSDLGIIAYQFTLSYDRDVLNIRAVETEGCMGSQWGEPTVNTNTPGTMIVVHYGVQPLSGSGVLIKLESEVLGNPGDTTQLRFDTFLLNDGDPEAEFEDPAALFTVTYTGVPILAVSPDTIDFGALDTLRSFSITNVGVGDLNWSVLEAPDIPWITRIEPSSGASDDTVTLTISRSGMTFGFYSETLSVQSSGGVEEIVVNMTVPQEFLIVTITVPDTSQYTSRWVELPIRVNDVTNMDIIAYQFTLTYDEDVVNIVGATTENSLAAGWGDPEVNTDTTGQISLEHYSTSPLLGEGTLVSVICYAVGDPGDTTTLSFDRFLFNDGYPHADWTTPAATFSVDTADVPLLFLSPSVLDFGASQTVNTFNVRNLGTDTLKWTVSEDLEVEWITSVSPRSGIGEGTVTVSVTRIGLAAGLYSGKVAVTSNGGDGDITVALTAPDGGRRITLSVPDTSAAVTTEVTIPVRVDDVTPFGIVDFEFTLHYDERVVEVLEAVSEMTLSDSWGLPTLDVSTPGEAHLTHQGQLPIIGRGTLIAFRMRAVGDLEDSSELTLANVLMNGNGTVSHVEHGSITVERPDYPVLAVSPHVLDFNSETTTKSFTIENNGSRTLLWGIFESPEKDWILSIFPTDGQDQGMVTVIVDRTGLYPDVYTGTLHIASNGGNQNVSVRMEVEETDILPPYLAFSSPQNDALDVARNIPVYVIIEDADSDVFGNSVCVVVDSDTVVSDGDDRTGGAVRFLPRSHGVGFVFHPQELFAEDYEVLVSLHAEDTALPSHEYNGLFTFTTGSATVGVTSEDMFGSEGGTVEDPDGVLVTVPPGVLSDSLTIAVGTVANPPPLPDTVVAVSGTFFFGPEGFTFCPLPGVGRLLYTEEDLANAGITDPLRLMVFSFNSESGYWEERQILSNDTNNGTVLFQVCRFGYVTLGATQITSVQDEQTSGGVPLDFRLMSCQPNPFNASTSIPFEVPDVRSPADVTIRIYNVLGEEIRILLQEQLPGGRYTTFWDGSDGNLKGMPSGIYFCHMSVQNSRGAHIFAQTQKLLFLK